MGGGAAGGGGEGTSSRCGSFAQDNITPERHATLLDAEKPGVLYVSVGISTSVCSCDRRSLDTHFVYAGDLRRVQQCDAGRTLCFFATRLSSCSSTGACDFVVGSPAWATSTGTSPPGPELSTLSPLGCWLLTTAADDGCALATVGLGRIGAGFEGALTPSPLPTCNGTPEIASTTITSLSLHSVPRHGGCLASCRFSWPWGQQGCAPHGHHRNLTPRVLMPADDESCELQRCPLSCQ